MFEPVASIEKADHDGARHGSGSIESMSYPSTLGQEG
jgi:hypothetical protein